MFFRIGPKLELILITINSIYCTVIVRDDLEEQKRREYETWFKNQEREQQLLEYDCSVQYVEKQPQQQQQREERYRQEVTSSTSTHVTTSEHQIKSTNISASKCRQFQDCIHLPFQVPRKASTHQTSAVL